MIGEDLPPIDDLEDWLSKLPMRPDGKKRWGLPAWGIPPCCRPVLHMESVELVNYTRDSFIESLKAVTKMDLNWNCYVNPHDSGYGGSQNRPYVLTLFVYWYLVRCDGYIGIYSDEIGFIDKETPIAFIDIQDKKKGETPIKTRAMPGVFYLCFSSRRLDQEYDTSAILAKLARDQYNRGWYEESEGMSLRELIGIFRNVIWDVIVYPSSYFAEKGTVRKDPVEIIVLRSNLADRPMKTWVPVTDEGSELCDSKVSHYAMIGSTEDNSYLGGATVTFHSSDSNSKLELVVFVDI